MHRKFIGGSLDGETLSIAEDLPYYKKVVAKPFKLSVSDMREAPVDAAFEMETYRLEKIRGDIYTFSVYLHSDISPDAMIRRLIESYRGAFEESIPDRKEVRPVSSLNSEDASVARRAFKLSSLERRAFESVAEKRGHDISREILPLGGFVYKNSITDLMWEVWLDSAIARM